MPKLNCVGAEFYGYNHVNNEGTTRRAALASTVPAVKNLKIIDCRALSSCGVSMHASKS